MKSQGINSFDPHFLLPSGTFFTTTGQRTWTPASRDELAERLQGSNPPEFSTVLAIQDDPDFDRMTADEVRKVAYSGPLYFDLDGESIEEAIDAFKTLLAKLQGLDLDLGAVRLFASGKRGFHLEVPPACFVPNGLPVGGVVGLPHIYREMAQTLYVDCLDMRVYSAKKGRMWRVPNRQRDNGQFKVPLSVDQALTVTPESYTTLCSAPREFPSLTAPTFCPALGLLYVKAKDKVAYAKPKRSSVGALRQRFGANLPPSIAALCEGRIPARGGWNAIALQLATVADELGIDEDALIERCRGLIQAHDSDGSRYNTPAKREAELRRMCRYVSGNVCYSASAGGLRSILPAGLRVNDFRGMV